MKLIPIKPEHNNTHFLNVFFYYWLNRHLIRPVERKNTILIYIALLFAVVLFSYCKSSEKLTGLRLQKKSPGFLFEKLRANEFQFEEISIKANTKFKSGDAGQSFISRIRMKKDSVIWISVSGFGIEAGRALITPDTVKILDKMNSQYFMGNFKLLSNLLGISVEFKMLQAILSGNYPEFYDDALFKSSVNGRSYVLQTFGKRKLRNRAIPDTNLPLLQQVIFLNSETFKIQSNSFSRFNSRESANVSYENFKEVESRLFPHRIKFEARGEQKKELQLKINKIETRKRQKYPFKIPANYTRIN